MFWCFNLQQHVLKTCRNYFKFAATLFNLQQLYIICSNLILFEETLFYLQQGFLICTNFICSMSLVGHRSVIYVVMQNVFLWNNSKVVYIKAKKKSGPRMLPFGTPLHSGRDSYNLELILTTCCQSLRSLRNHWRQVLEAPTSFNLSNRISLLMLSNSLLISNNIIAVSLLSWKPRFTRRFNWHCFGWVPLLVATLVLW